MIRFSLSVESHVSYCLHVAKPCSQHDVLEDRKVYNANVEKNWHHVFGMLDDFLEQVTSQ